MDTKDRQVRKIELITNYTRVYTLTAHLVIKDTLKTAKCVRLANHTRVHTLILEQRIHQRQPSA